MPNTRPVSDLREYSKVLNDVAPGSPVILTKNGKPCYVIVDINEYNKMESEIRHLAKSLRNRSYNEVQKTI